MSEVAVVVPAWNAARTIAATLESALAQSLPPAEIVVVDDGSDDATCEIVTAFAARHPAVRLLRQRRLGPSAARNRAIAETAAPIVAPLDADDLWHRDYLSACVARLEALGPRGGFASAWHHLVDEEGRRLRGPMEFDIEGGGFGAMLLVNFVGNGSAAVFCRDAIAEAGGYQAPLPHWPGAEDYLLQLRIAARRPVAVVPRDLVAYRRHRGSISADTDAAHVARLAAVARALDEFGPERLPVSRWVRADAARVRAAGLLAAGRPGSALGWGLRTLLADPGGTLAELGLRLANLARRRPGAEAPRPLDPLLARRLARLRKAMPYGSPKVRPAQPSILPVSWAAK